jgi:hypothetical protein
VTRETGNKAFVLPRISVRARPRAGEFPGRAVGTREDSDELGCSGLALWGSLGRDEVEEALSVRRGTRLDGEFSRALQI